MNFLVIIKTALKALRQNAMRAILTILGIVIGIAAVIAMVEIGAGSASTIKQTIANMGANNIIIIPGTAASSGVSFGAGSSLTLTSEDWEAVSRECPSVKYSAPIIRVRTQIVYGNKNWVPPFLYGTTPSFLDVRDWQNLEEGVMFSEKDIKNANKVCVIGKTIAKELFGAQSPIGQEIRIKNIGFQVIGVLSSKGANMMGMDQDDIVLAPWTTIKYQVSGTSSGGTIATTDATTSSFFPGTQVQLYPQSSAAQTANSPLQRRFANIDQILVAAGSATEIPMAIDEITTLLRQRHHLRPEEPDDFSLRDMTEMTKAVSSTQTVMTNLLLCVSLISLIVGGVGIMNIMLVSVTERTREIGIRMAIGARQIDIKLQFLVEAIVLCVIGGIIGVLLGIGISALVSLFLSWPTETSIAAIFIAVIVSAAVGIIFGYYPAAKASKLDPIEALRYE